MVSSLLVPTQTSSQNSNSPFLHLADADGSMLNTSSSSSPADRMQHDDDGKEPPHIVLYMVEPFTCGTDKPETERLACLSLLRCYSNILNQVPDSIRSNISVQVGILGARIDLIVL